jgi:hypothetical protein
MNGYTGQVTVKGYDNMTALHRPRHPAARSPGTA